MTQYLIDMNAGCLRPVWTDMEAIGFLAYYLDANDPAPAEEQMAAGYEDSAGFAPYPQKPEDYYTAPDPETEGQTILHSRRYPEDPPYGEVSRTTAADGSTVIMFDAAMTAVIRDDKIVWIARLD